MGDFIPPLKEGEENNTTFLGIKFTGTVVPFLISTVGIFTCYCCSSIAQEYLYEKGYEYTSHITFVAKFTSMAWGAAFCGFSDRKVPHNYHLAVGVLNFGTMWLSNESLKYLNYPTQTLFKSAKIIPVMLGSVMLLHYKFLFIEYLSAFMLSIGLVLFTWTDFNTMPDFNFLGVFLISSALICDALLGNLQEKMFRLYSPNSQEMMTWANLYASILSALMCVYEAEISQGVAVLANDMTLLWAILIYSFFNIIGIFFVLYMISYFGVTLTTFTTSLRKALTVVLSFTLFSKVFLWTYGVGSVCTLIGIGLNMKASQIKRDAKLKQATMQKKQEDYHDNHNITHNNNSTHHTKNGNSPHVSSPVTSSPAVIHTTPSSAISPLTSSIEMQSLLSEPGIDNNELQDDRAQQPTLSLKSLK